MPDRIADGPPKNMPIIAQICNNVNDYMRNGPQKIEKMLAEGILRCQRCSKPLFLHSKYQRNIKETGERLLIVVVRCKSSCQRGSALLPDFIAPRKHYSLRAIEEVLSAAQGKRVSEIDTHASESTVRRWLLQVGARITMAISVVKAIFSEMGEPVSEMRLDQRGGFAELESLLDAAPRLLRHSGLTLRLANLWLGMCSSPTYM